MLNFKRKSQEIYSADQGLFYAVDSLILYPATATLTLNQYEQATFKAIHGLNQRAINAVKYAV